jgi:hypothetical protein
LDKKLDDILFKALVLINLIGGLLIFQRASYGEVIPLFIWATNCGLVSLAGTLIED